MNNYIYISKPEYLHELCEELQEVSAIHHNLVFSPAFKSDVCFALDIWLNPQQTKIDSISQAAKILRSNGKYWYLNPVSNIRRSVLIKEQLKSLPDLQLPFPPIENLPNIGCFSLLDKDTLIYSSQRWKKIPLGHYQFIEDKQNPPNRAYLKLWEAFSLLEIYPKKGELALDLGASPGGWSYVLQSLGADVIAVDKAPLADKIMRLPKIKFLKQSMFALNPQDFSTIDWLVCDAACYPARLYDFISKWLASGKVKHFICTIKLQGKTDFAAIRQFQTIPNSMVLHLYHNKHEVTFIHPAPKHFNCLSAIDSIFS